MMSRMVMIVDLSGNVYITGWITNEDDEQNRVETIK